MRPLNIRQEVVEAQVRFMPSIEGIKYCGVCDRDYDPKEPDPCIGFIPGCSHACCGHGEERFAYVVLGGEPNQSVNSAKPHGHPFLTLRGRNATMFFDAIKDGKENPEFPCDKRGC